MREAYLHLWKKAFKPYLGKPCKNIAMYEYLYFIVVLSCFVLTFAYIKIRYPFWNVQPVYHTYDFWRWFYRTPFLIQRGAPLKPSSTRKTSKPSRIQILKNT